MGITGDECEEILRARGKEVTRPPIEEPEKVLPPRNESEGKGGTVTGTVWDNIKATQDNYPNTNIPRSFEVEVNGQKMWVHGNATEHMYDDVYAKIMAGEGTAYTNPNLYTQELMSDFHGSLELYRKNSYTEFFARAQFIKDFLSRIRYNFSKPGSVSDAKMLRIPLIFGITFFFWTIKGTACQISSFMYHFRPYSFFKVSSSSTL